MLYWESMRENTISQRLFGGVCGKIVFATIETLTNLTTLADLTEMIVPF